MRAKSNRLLLLGVFFIGLVLGVIILTSTNGLPNSSSAETDNQEFLVEEPVAVGIEAMYEEYTLEDMMAQADAILIGEVVSILPPRWNQDSGEYWEGGDAMQLHQFDIAVSQVLVDTLSLGEKFTITALGNNPVRTEDDTIDISGGSSHALEVGNQGIFFVIGTVFPWKDGKIPIIGFLGDPKDGYLLAGEDGLYHSRLVPDGISLDELQTLISQFRP